MPLPRKAILLLLDSLPLGVLGCYGGFGEKTPAFDRLAAQGAVFENACTPVVTDAGSAFEEHGPWPVAWHAFAADLRDRGGILDEIVCTTLAALAEAASLDRVVAFLGREEPGLLAILGPELVPPPVHGHLAAVDKAVGAIHAAIESAAASETLLVVGALQGAVTGGSDTNEDQSESEANREADGATGRNGRADASFPQLVAQRINVPLLVRLPVPVVPGLRVQALVTTTDIVTTLGTWLAPGEQEAREAGHPGPAGFDLLPLVRCEVEAIRDEILIRGPREIALRTADRFVVVRTGETVPASHEAPEIDQRPVDRSDAFGPVPGGDGYDETAATVAVFRKPEDVWDQLDVGNTMPEERDMLVDRCLKLFTDAAK